MYIHTVQCTVDIFSFFKIIIKMYKQTKKGVSKKLDCIDRNSRVRGHGISVWRLPFNYCYCVNTSKYFSSADCFLKCVRSLQKNRGGARYVFFYSAVSLTLWRFIHTRKTQRIGDHSENTSAFE